jgi:oxygen-dependent protoporphyrinogen oxidase
MTPLRVVVVGGGMAGLAAAHRLVETAREREEPLDLMLVEAGDRLGGTIRTEQRDGFLLEGGPDSFVAEKPWALALAQRLGLGPELRGADDRVRRTFVVRGGRLRPLPEGFLLLAPTRVRPVLASDVFSWRGKLRMALDLVLPRRTDGGDESVASFVRRRLGREALERVAQPLLRGIYAAEPERLSLAATLPRFAAIEREHRSLILGLRRSAVPRETAAGRGARFGPFVTLAGGMETLVRALASRLPAASVRLGTPAVAVEAASAGPGWRVRLGAGPPLAADGVILAGPAHGAARLLHGVDPELARLLAGIGYASSVTVALGYPRGAVGHPLDGFGYVVPRTEGRRALACTFSSVKYAGRAPAGAVLLRVFLGDAGEGAAPPPGDAELVAAAHADVASLLGIAGEPTLARVWRHARAMPQYDVGHLDRVAAIESRLAGLGGLALAGTAFRGVGLADAVRSGEEAADRLTSTLKGRDG